MSLPRNRSTRVSSSVDSRVASAAAAMVERLETRTLMSTTIINDPFTDGGYTDGADAMDVPWFKPAGNLAQRRQRHDHRHRQLRFAFR